MTLRFEQQEAIDTFNVYFDDDTHEPKSHPKGTLRVGIKQSLRWLVAWESQRF